MGEWRTNRKLTRAADLPALIHCESVGFRKDDGAFHHVLQLADIAGPIVGSEERQRVLIDTPDLLAGPFGEPRERNTP
jgi:hypothetical protein